MAKDFTEDIDIIGILRCGEDSSSSVRATFTYGEAAPGVIRGYIYGNEKECDSVGNIFNKKSFDLQLISDPTCSQQLNIADSNLTIKKFYPRLCVSSVDSERAYKIADFELAEFSQIDSVKDERKCEITYLLYGPEGVWMDTGYRSPSYTGEVEVKSNPVILQINNEMEVTCIIENHYLWDGEEKNGKEVQKSIRVKSLSFDFPDSSEVKMEDFLISLDRIVERILLASSFVGRSRTDWYSRQSTIGSEWIYRYKARVDWRVTERDNSDDLIVPRRDVTELLQSMVKRIYETDNNGFDLKMPIFYLLSSYETKTIEQSFTFAFLSLEKLLNQYFQSADKLILSEKEVRPLLDKFKHVIKDKILEREKRDYLYKKMLGLNRFPIRVLLEKILADFSIEWRDLYPKDNDLTIVQTRNQLLHGVDIEEINAMYLWKESIRTQAIVERIILRLVGWEELSEAPNRYKIKLLQRVEDS